MSELPLHVIICAKTPPKLDRRFKIGAELLTNVIENSRLIGVDTVTELKKCLEDIQAKNKKSTMLMLHFIGHGSGPSFKLKTPTAWGKIAKAIIDVKVKKDVNICGIWIHQCSATAAAGVVNKYFLWDKSNPDIMIVGNGDCYVLSWDDGDEEDDDGDEEDDDGDEEDDDGDEKTFPVSGSVAAFAIALLRLEKEKKSNPDVNPDLGAFACSMKSFGVCNKETDEREQTGFFSAKVIQGRGEKYAAMKANEVFSFHDVDDAHEQWGQIAENYMSSCKLYKEKT